MCVCRSSRPRLLPDATFWSLDAVLCLCVPCPPRRAPPRTAARAAFAHSLSCCCRPPRGGRRAALVLWFGAASTDASMAAATKTAAADRVHADAEAQGARDAHGQSARPRARRRRRAGRRPARRPRARPGRRRRGPRPPRGRPRAGRLAGPRRLASYALMYSICPMMSFVDSLSCTGRPREVCVRSSGWSCE